MTLVTCWNDAVREARKCIECPICKDPCKNPVRPKNCPHRYCMDCFRRCFQDKQNKPCATCRTPILSVSKRGFTQDLLFEKVAEIVPGIRNEVEDDLVDLAAMMKKRAEQDKLLREQAQKLRAEQGMYDSHSALEHCRATFLCLSMRPRSICRDTGRRAVRGSVRPSYQEDDGELQGGSGMVRVHMAGVAQPMERSTSGHVRSLPVKRGSDATGTASMPSSPAKRARIVASEGSHDSVEKVTASAQEGSVGHNGKRSFGKVRNACEVPLGFAAPRPPRAGTEQPALLPATTSTLHVDESDRIVELFVYMSNHKLPKVATMPWGHPVNGVVEIVRKAGLLDQLQGVLTLGADGTGRDVTALAAGEVATLCSDLICVNIK